LLVCLQGSRLIKAEVHALQHFVSERASMTSLRERPIAWMPIPNEEYAGLYMRNWGARLLLLPAQGWLRSALALSSAYLRHLVNAMPPGTYMARAKAELTLAKLRSSRAQPPDSSRDSVRPPSNVTVAAPCTVSTPTAVPVAHAPRGFRSRGGGRFARRGRGLQWAFTAPR
jgi:hypothetical protein